MRLVPSQTGSRIPKRTPLQRGLAVLLVFLFVQDIGFHIAEPFFIAPEGPTHPVLLGGHGFPDTDTNGFPNDDDGLPFHHHHYPALVAQEPLPILLVAVARVVETLPVESIHASVVHPIGRAPPLA